jgi:hypothetical protein
MTRSTAQKLAGRADALLFVEPAGAPSSEPIVDDITRRLTAAWRARRSVGSYRGHHTNACDPGVASDNRDHYLRGAQCELLTHSLCIRYVAHFRAELPVGEIEKIALLPAVYADPTAEELAPRGPGRASNIRDGRYTWPAAIVRGAEGHPVMDVATILGLTIASDGDGYVAWTTMPNAPADSIARVTEVATAVRADLDARARGKYAVDVIATTDGVSGHIAIRPVVPA